MRSYATHTLREYLDRLASNAPVPGGGSAAALVASTGAALVVMAARYSLGKGKPQRVEKRLKQIVRAGEALRLRFLKLTDLDARAYLNVVKTVRTDKRKYRAALRQAARVPGETARLCMKAVDLTPYLVEQGNPHLLSDVEVAVELLFAAYKAAMINVRVNQS